MHWVFINHEFIKAEDANVSIYDRGFLFGDGVFTTAKVENGKIWNCKAHFKRLASQCKLLNIIPPKLSEDVLYELIEKNQAFNGLWKLKVIITGGVSSELTLSLRKFGTFLAMMEPYKQPVGEAKICKYPFLIEIPNASIKSLSYLHRLMVKQYALDKGFDDAIVCSSEGWVLETAFSNLFWSEGGKVTTPQKTMPLLPGTYISSLPDCVEDAITYEQLKSKREVYICNALFVRSCKLA